MDITNKLKAIGDAIRQKTGKPDLLTMDDMAVEISNIHVGDDISPLLSGSATTIESDATHVREYCFYRYTNLISASFPAAKTMGSSCFNTCAALTSVSIPLVDTLYSSNFSGCTALTSVDMPSIKKLTNNIFYGCTSLIHLDFAVLESVGANCFAKSGLQSLTIRTPNVCAAGASFLADTPISTGTGRIYVPADLVESYKTAAYWQDFAGQIKAIN